MGADGALRSTVRRRTLKRMNSLSRRIGAVAGLCLLALGAAQGQRVRGEVRQEDGTSPALGVVIVATRADGSVAGRALSGENGRFDLPLSTGGTYTLSALRIGYRPTVVEGVMVEGAATATVQIRLAGVAVPLAAVDVRGRDVCGTARDPQAQVAAVWTEARTALAAAALWSREQLDAEWITYKRELRLNSDFVKSQEVRVARNPTTHAFRSWYAESLATRGYMINDVAGAVYHAPDPEVLLSESFAETHCFHTEPAPDRSSGLVGVGFTPQRTRGDRVEIEGTLWIDRATSELRTLEYRYVGLPDAADGANPGGRVEFLRLPDGPWMVSRWHIRMPIIGSNNPADIEKGYARQMLKTSGPILQGVALGGGQVSRVSRRGTLIYEGQGAGIALQLVRPDSEASVAGALVKLDGTDYAWRADSSGLVKASPVLDGHYRAQVATAEMLALGAEPIERDLVIAPGRTKIDTMSVPSSRDVVRNACGSDAARQGLSALVGVVRDSAGRPAAGRAVLLSWFGGATIVGNRLIETKGRTTAGTVADDAGIWHACDVPRGRSITVRAQGDDGQGVADVVVPEGRWMYPVVLTMSRTATSANDSLASVELIVKDAAGTPVGTTAIELTAASGESRRVTTDNRGRALLTDFPPGLAKLKPKRAGYTSGDVMFTVAGGRNTVPIILGQQTLPRLDTVRVVGNRRESSRLDAFVTRRARREATASFDTTDIARRSFTEVSDMLRGVVGVRVADSAGVFIAQLTRGFSLDRNANGQPCVMRVVVDGMLMPLEAGVNVARPSELLGLEVFTSAARAPVGTGVSAEEIACGLIIMYTRGRR